MTATTILPEVTKRIAWNKKNKDYDCFVSIDGAAEQYIGSREVHGDAEALCRDYAFSYYEDNHTPEKAAAVAMADELPDAPATDYPTSTGSDGCVDQEKCERLGLGAQWKQVILDERADGMLLMLSGTGELLIRPAGEPACVLDFTETAALITFMSGGNTKRLFPAILRASLLASGGAAAALAEKIDAVLGAAPLAAPAIQAEQWQSEDGTVYTDFVIGDGLTKVLIGTHGGQKSGVELIIGKSPLNERVEEVMTLDDVRQLRDNLTALLNDAGLAAALVRDEAGAPQRPTPPTCGSSAAAWRKAA